MEMMVEDALEVVDLVVKESVMHSKRENATEEAVVVLVMEVYCLFQLLFSSKNIYNKLFFFFNL